MPERGQLIYDNEYPVKANKEIYKSIVYERGNKYKNMTFKIINYIYIYTVVHIHILYSSHISLTAIIK